MILTSSALALVQVLLFKEAKELSKMKCRELISITILLLNVPKFQLRNDISSCTIATAYRVNTEQVW